MAEVIANGIRLGLHESFLGCSGSKLMYRILCSLMPINPNDSSLATQLNRLLKYMRKYFDKLLPRWESQEKMFFVDGVMREGRHHNMFTNEEALEIRSLVGKTVRFIIRNPIFTFIQKSTVVSSLHKKHQALLICSLRMLVMWR